MLVKKSSVEAEEEDDDEDISLSKADNPDPPSLPKPRKPCQNNTKKKKKKKKKEAAAAAAAESELDDEHLEQSPPSKRAKTAVKKRRSKTQISPAPGPCPHCGKEFTSLGGYTNHVEKCARRPHAVLTAHLSMHALGHREKQLRSKSNGQF